MISDSSLVGSIPVTPVLTIDSVVGPSSDDAKHAHLGWIDSAELIRVAFAPLRVPSTTTYLRVSSRDGYQDDVPAHDVESLTRDLLSGRVATTPPVVLSGRGRWVWSPTDPPLGRIQVFHAAAVIAGHREIGAYAKANREEGFRTNVPFLLFPMLDIEQEIALYERLRLNESKETNHSWGTPRSNVPIQLRVGTDWTDVEIVSEPFVVLTRLGYTPVLTVEEISSREQYGLYAGARSLAKELERIRDATGRLTGTRIRVRKTGVERTAGYEVRLL